MAGSASGAAAYQLVVVGLGQQPAGGGQRDVEGRERGRFVAGFEGHLGDGQPLHQVVEHGKGPKIVIHKFKNKTGYHKRQGHRQQLTTLKVTGIDAGK